MSGLPPETKRFEGTRTTSGFGGFRCNAYFQNISPALYWYGCQLHPLRRFKQRRIRMRSYHRRLCKAILNRKKLLLLLLPWGDCSTLAVYWVLNLKTESTPWGQARGTIGTRERGCDRDGSRLASLNDRVSVRDMHTRRRFWNGLLRHPAFRLLECPRAGSVCGCRTFEVG